MCYSWSSLAELRHGDGRHSLIAGVGSSCGADIAIGGFQPEPIVGTEDGTVRHRLDRFAKPRLEIRVCAGPLLSLLVRPQRRRSRRHMVGLDLLRVDQRRVVQHRPAPSTEPALTRGDAPPTSSNVQPDPNELAVKRAVKRPSSGAVTRPRFATQPRSPQRRTNATKPVIAMRRKRPVRTVGNSPSLSSS